MLLRSGEGVDDGGVAAAVETARRFRNTMAVVTKQVRCGDVAARDGYHHRHHDGTNKRTRVGGTIREHVGNDAAAGDAGTTTTRPALWNAANA